MSEDASLVSVPLEEDPPEYEESESGGQAHTTATQVDGTTGTRRRVAAVSPPSPQFEETRPPPVQLLPLPPSPPPVVSSHPQLFVSCPALHTAVYPEPILRGSTPIRVVPRCGDVGRSDKVEWRLTAHPHITVATGTRVALCDVAGSYRFISRTVGPIVGADQRWVTFLLSAGLSAPATTQTLTVPREHAGIPIVVRCILLLLACFLADEHPYAPTPLPDLE